jgi:nitrous oxidase accessory protein NosD
MKTRTWSLLTGAVLMAVTAACGGGGDAPSAAGAEASSSSRGPTSGAASGAQGAQTSSTPTATGTPAQYRKVWRVSPNGNDSAEGSEGAPLRTIGRAVTLAEPGDLISVQPGTYAEYIDIGAESRDGTPTAKITLKGEGTPKIVPGAGKWAMIDVRRQNWILDGFEIDARGQARAGVVFSGDVQGSVLANSEVHNGSAGAAVATAANAHGVTIEGNHIHHYSRGNIDAHGVLVNTTTHDVTIRDNRIHDVSGDSVQCIGPEGYSNNAPATDVLIEGNDFWSNRENAVDIKTCHRVTVRGNKMHDFTRSLPGGTVVVVHMSARDIVVEDNDIYEAGKGVALGGNHTGPVPTNVVIQNNRIRAMRKGNTLDGTAVRVENSQGAVVQGNTFSDLQGPAMFVGHGSQGATKDLRVENNLFEAATAYNLGGQAPGFSSQHNTFVTGATFSANRTSLDLSGWQQLGYDADATQVAAAN